MSDRMVFNGVQILGGESRRARSSDLTLGVDRMFAVMDVWRGRYNRTTDRARRARMRRVIDAAAWQHDADDQE